MEGNGWWSGLTVLPKSKIERRGAQQRHRMPCPPPSLVPPVSLSLFLLSPPDVSVRANEWWDGRRSLHQPQNLASKPLQRVPRCPVFLGDGVESSSRLASRDAVAEERGVDAAWWWSGSRLRCIRSSATILSFAIGVVTHPSFAAVTAGGREPNLPTSSYCGEAPPPKTAVPSPNTPTSSHSPIGKTRKPHHPDFRSVLCIWVRRVQAETNVSVIFVEATVVESKSAWPDHVELVEDQESSSPELGNTVTVIGVKDRRQVWITANVGDGGLHLPDGQQRVYIVKRRKC
ncbi:hypothetical protein NL676_032226 [Syzygium grande]|nr:hypothetical protein NL676_032226 [Syzygium grande]